MPSDVVEILILQSTHKLLKNIGGLSICAKCSQSLTKIKRILKSLSYILDTIEMVKKTISRFCPFKGTVQPDGSG
jgi:hypothetical protein